MSDDQTIRIGPDGPGDRPPRRRRDNTALGTVFGLGIALLILSGFIALADRDVSSGSGAPPSGQPPTSEGVTTAPATATAKPPPSTSPSSLSSEPSPSGPSPGPSASLPTDADATAFIAEYEASYGDDHRSLASDMDGDGLNELVFARITGGVAVLDIARWAGAGYEIVYSGEGGSADRVDSLVARDVNGEPGAEIVVGQSAGESGSSLAIWGASGDRYVPQRARGGCWRSSNSYGITGAAIASQRITATCDGSPLPRSAWTSDVYVWTDGRWTYERTEAASG